MHDSRKRSPVGPHTGAINPGLPTPPPGSPPRRRFSPPPSTPPAPQEPRGRFQRLTVSRRRRTPSPKPPVVVHARTVGHGGRTMTFRACYGLQEVKPSHARVPRP